MWLVAGLSVALGGCFYFEPVNRRPRIVQLLRLCDDRGPADPCDVSELRRGERVVLWAVFYDPDGDERHGSVRWRIMACGESVVLCDTTAEDCEDQRLACDPDRPFDEPSYTATFTVPQTSLPEKPVIIVELMVFDERGASSLVQFPSIPVHDGPRGEMRDTSSRLVGSWD